MIPYTDLQTQYQECKNDVDEAIEYVLSTNQFITGPIIEEFEEAIVENVKGPRHTDTELACAGVGSGTIALLLALQACEIEEGSEVITTPMTFVSTPESIVNAGLVPVFADVDVDGQIDCDCVVSMITERTRAILFVDLWGDTPDIHRLVEIAKKHNLYLIEDAAQAYGTVYDTYTVGSIPGVHLTCFSHNPVKNFGAIGDAGSVVGDKELIERIKLLRNHGRADRYDLDMIGWNGRMDCLQAKVLIAKLKHVDYWNNLRYDTAIIYDENLVGVGLPFENDLAVRTHYAYVIRHQCRDYLQQYLANRGVQTNIHFKTPCHMAKAFNGYPHDCPMAERMCREILSLPVYHNLSDDNQKFIIDTINEFTEKLPYEPY